MLISNTVRLSLHSPHPPRVLVNLHHHLQPDDGQDDVSPGYEHLHKDCGEEKTSPGAVTPHSQWRGAPRLKTSTCETQTPSLSTIRGSSSPWSSESPGPGSKPWPSGSSSPPPSSLQTTPLPPSTTDCLPRRSSCPRASRWSPMHCRSLPTAAWWRSSCWRGAYPSLAHSNLATASTHGGRPREETW